MKQKTFLLCISGAIVGAAIYVTLVGIVGEGAVTPAIGAAGCAGYFWGKKYSEYLK